MVYSKEENLLDKSLRAVCINSVFNFVFIQNVYKIVRI